MKLQNICLIKVLQKPCVCEFFCLCVCLFVRFKIIEQQTTTTPTKKTLSWVVGKLWLTYFFLISCQICPHKKISFGQLFANFVESLRLEDKLIVKKFKLNLKIFVTFDKKKTFSYHSWQHSSWPIYLICQCFWDVSTQLKYQIWGF